MTCDRIAVLRRVPVVLAAVMLCSPASAGEADVVDVRVQMQADGSYRFAATVRHADEGWDHYADAFEIIGPDDDVLGARVLAHPHVNEQPFTRSLGGVKIPRGVATVKVRARDKVHGLGGKAYQVTLPGRSQ